MAASSIESDFLPLRERPNDRLIWKNGKITRLDGTEQKTYINDSGYYEWSFKIRIAKGEYKPVHVWPHRSVAIQFLENKRPDVYKVVNHLDENKLNNDVSNLQWCTYSQNTLHSKHNLFFRYTYFHKYSYELVNGRALVLLCTYESVETAYLNTGITYDSLAHMSNNEMRIIPSDIGQNNGFVLIRTGSRVQSRFTRLETRLKELPSGFYRHVKFTSYAVKDGGRILRINTKEEIKVKRRGKAKPRVALYIFDEEKYEYKRITMTLARIMALQFVPIPAELSRYDIEDLRVVMKDGDRSNNYASNLVWTTKNESTTYHTRKAVDQYDLKGNHLNTFISITEASKKTGVSVKKICRILEKRDINRSDEYIWVYKPVKDAITPVIFENEISDDKGQSSESIIEYQGEALHDDEPPTSSSVLYSVEERISRYIPSFPLFSEIIANSGIVMCDDRWKVLDTFINADAAYKAISRKRIFKILRRDIIASCEGSKSLINGYRFRYVRDEDPAKVYEPLYNDDNPFTWKRYPYNVVYTVSQLGHLFSLSEMRLKYPNQDGFYEIEGSDERFTMCELADSVYHDSIEKNPHHWRKVPGIEKIVASLQGIIYRTGKNGNYSLCSQVTDVKRPTVDVKKKRKPVNDLVVRAWNRNMITD